MEHASEDEKFKAFMRTVEDLDDTPMEGSMDESIDEPNVESAKILAEQLNTSLEVKGELSRAEIVEAREKIKILVDHQMIYPKSQEIQNALVRLRDVLRKSEEGSKEAA